MSRALVLVVVAAVLASPSRTPRASCPAQLAERARTAYQQGAFEKAMVTTADLERCRDGTAAELAEAVRWRALAAAIARGSDEAMAAFVLLETISPGYVLDPMLSPKFHELHQKARARAPLARLMFVRVKEPVESASGWAARVELFDRFQRATAVVVHFETLDGRTVEVPAERLDDTTWVAAAPLGASGFYWGQVRGNGPSMRTQSAPVPQAVPRLTPRPEPAPVFAPRVADSPAEAQSNDTKKWIVIGAGAAVAAVAVILVTGVAASQGQGGGDQSDSLGRVTLP